MNFAACGWMITNTAGRAAVILADQAKKVFPSRLQSPQSSHQLVPHPDMRQRKIFLSTSAPHTLPNAPGISQMMNTGQLQLMS